MSVIAQKDEEYYLYTKGADNKMIPHINWNSTEQKQVLMKHLDEFAIEGLRTLVMGRKRLTEVEFEDIIREIENIKAKGGKDKDSLFAELYEKHENGLEFIGASAIEDKLQDKVPETIAKLIESNIRVWVLTGDKQETAVEIAKSCKLIQPIFEVVTLTIKMSDAEDDKNIPEEEAKMRKSQKQKEYKNELKNKLIERK